MLHDNLITENFLHHVQKEHSVSPPQSNSPTKINLYNSFHYKQMQNQLIHHRHQQQQQQKLYQHQENDKVLDLSRRCEPDGIQQDKTSSPQTSPYQFQSSSIVRQESGSPIQRSEISASLLAENLQKFYNHQQDLLTKPSLINGTLLPNQSQSSLPPLYPIYYPQIKQELTDSLTNSTMIQQQQQQKEFDSHSLSAQSNILQIPQPIGNNMFPSNEHLLKRNASYPTSNQNLENTKMISIISPKSGLKADLTDTDKLSDTSSIPGSPSSSSTSIIQYPKLLNSTTTTTIASLPNSEISSINKPTRPFKAFPRDPLVIAANFAATDVLYNNPRVELYTEYRKRVLEQIRSANGGERTISNPKMRRLNTRNNFNCSNTNVSSDGSYSDSQANNSETEERANDSSSDNDTTVQSTTNFENNSNNMKRNRNDSGSESKNKDTNKNNGNHGILKDASYYERRRKNNAAAKKSRDRRRIKEDEIAIRAAYLERQNIELLCQLETVKAQLAALTKVQAS